ncbi:SDR family oxidoreductase, partial [Burkholderia gladioli]
MNSKVALVTGASSGIGRSVALGLLQAGYRVALAARKLDALEQVAAESGAGERALPISCDVGDEAAVQRLFDTIESRWGRLDLLFNNAGVFTPQCSLEDLAVAQWKQAVDINLTGAFLCLQGAFRLMKRQQPQGG